MAHRYMVLPSETNEFEMLSKIYQTSRYNNSHFGLTIVTSMGCNFDCPYCFESKYPSIMNDEVQQNILKLLERQISDNKIRSLHVTWFGGEPLLGKKPLLAFGLAN